MALHTSSLVCFFSVYESTCKFMDKNCKSCSLHFLWQQVAILHRSLHQWVVACKHWNQQFSLTDCFTLFFFFFFIYWRLSLNLAFRKHLNFHILSSICARVASAEKGEKSQLVSLKQFQWRLSETPDFIFKLAMYKTYQMWFSVIFEYFKK